MTNNPPFQWPIPQQSKEEIIKEIINSASFKKAKQKIDVCYRFENYGEKFLNAIIQEVSCKMGTPPTRRQNRISNYCSRKLTILEREGYINKLPIEDESKRFDFLNKRFIWRWRFTPWILSLIAVIFSGISVWIAILAYIKTDNKQYIMIPQTLAKPETTRSMTRKTVLYMVDSLLKSTPTKSPVIAPSK